MESQDGCRWRWGSSWTRGHSLAKGIFLSTDQLYTARGHAWKLEWYLPRAFPKRTNSGSQPGRRGPPSSPAPEGTPPALAGVGRAERPHFSCLRTHPEGTGGGGRGGQAGAALLCFRILHLGSLWRPDGLLPLLGSPRGPAGLTTSMNAGKGAACPPGHPACRTGSAPRPTPPGPPASPPGAIMWPCPPLLVPSLQQGAMDREGSTGTPTAA